MCAATNDPDGYTRTTPDPKTHGQAMCSSLLVEWIKSQALEMQGLWNQDIFHKVLRTSLIPQDRVLSSRFHYKIQLKGGEFDMCKVRLVVQGQHIKRKILKALAITTTFLALCQLLVGFEPF